MLTVAKWLTFAGAGARSAILDGQSATQIFSITSASAAVTIKGLTLRNGKTEGSGGAIESEAPLTLIEDAIIGNTSTEGSGGGVSARAQLTMERDLLAANSAPKGVGGGLMLWPPSASTSVISDSTIALNSARNDGGGVNEDNTSTETLDLFNDTFVGNKLTEGGAQGGAFRAWSTTKIAFRNTLFAENTAASGPNCAYGGGATVTSLGHNAQDLNDSQCNFGPTDLVNIAPKLGSLTNNGGPTDSLLPAATSPLIGAGDAANCATTDQRGVPRPQAGICDIGAVERTTPSAGTPTATAITTTSATLSATAGILYIGGSFSYRYGPTTAYGSTTPTASLAEGLASGAAITTLPGLAPATTYHAQLLVTTPDGSVASGDVAFTTLSSTTAPPAPVLGGAKQSASRWREGSALAKFSRRKRKLPTGSTFSFTLNTAATVTFNFTHQVAGVRVGRKCLAKGRKAAKHKGCKLTSSAATLSFAGHAGINTLAFQGRISHSKRLKPGRYTLLIEARNASGRAKSERLTFTIVK